MSKTLNARMKQKSDTTTNWEKATNFTPLAGELVHYSDVDRLKIGDGTTKINQLSFIDVENNPKTFFDVVNGSYPGSIYLNADAANTSASNYFMLSANNDYTASFEYTVPKAVHVIDVPYIDVMLYMTADKPSPLPADFEVKLPYTVQVFLNGSAVSKAVKFGAEYISQLGTPTVYVESNKAHIHFSIPVEGLVNTMLQKGDVLNVRMLEDSSAVNVHDIKIYNCLIVDQAKYLSFIQFNLTKNSVHAINENVDFLYGHAEQRDASGNYLANGKERIYKLSKSGERKAFSILSADGDGDFEVDNPRNALTGKEIVNVDTLRDSTYRLSVPSAFYGSSILPCLAEDSSTIKGYKQEVMYARVAPGGGFIPKRDGNGQIELPTTPTANIHAASKYYVDNAVNSIKDSASYTFTLSSAAGDLPQEVINKLEAADNATLILKGYRFVKKYTDNSSIIFYCVSSEESNTRVDVEKIIINKTHAAYHTTDLYFDTNELKPYVIDYNSFNATVYQEALAAKSRGQVVEIMSYSTYCKDVSFDKVSSDNIITGQNTIDNNDYFITLHSDGTKERTSTDKRRTRITTQSGSFLDSVMMNSGNAPAGNSLVYTGSNKISMLGVAARLFLESGSGYLNFDLQPNSANEKSANYILPKVSASESVNVNIASTVDLANTKTAAVEEALNQVRKYIMQENTVESASSSTSVEILPNTILIATTSDGRQLDAVRVVDSQGVNWIDPAWVVLGFRMAQRDNAIILAYRGGTNFTIKPISGNSFWIRPTGGTTIKIQTLQFDISQA